jgi:hypothetical protein
MFGVIGVVAGITTGLVLSSIVLLLATRQFKGKIEQKLSLWRIGLWSTPVLMAGLVNFGCMQLEFWGFGLSAIYTLGIIGCLLTLLVSFVVLPLRPLMTKHLGLS